MYDLRQQLHLIPRAIALTVVFLMAYMFVLDNKNRLFERIRTLCKNRWLVAFFFYFVFLVLSTLIVRRVTYPLKNIFNDFGLFINGKINYELIENALLFIPFSYLFIKAFKPSAPWKSSLLLSFATSAIIEACQLLFWLGEFQLSDIVHNTFGGMIGCGLWYIKAKKVLCIICKRLLHFVRKGKHMV